MNSSFKISVVAVGLVGAAVSCFAGGKVELVPISEVKISGTSVFAPAVKADVAYVLALDPDRLLAPFRREAGLPEKGVVFGVVLSNTPPRSTPDKHWACSKFGGVLGENRKEACKTFAVSKVVVTLRLTTS